MDVPQLKQNLFIQFHRRRSEQCFETESPLTEDR